jgi:hypothetical protein
MHQDIPNGSSLPLFNCELDDYDSVSHICLPYAKDRYLFLLQKSKTGRGSSLES